MKTRNASPFPGIAVVDFCLNLVLVFAVLAKLSTAAVNSKQQEQKKSAPTSALYMIKVEWRGTSNSDVDTYVSDPDNHFVYFKRLADDLMVLTHDCTGAESNRITLPNGEVVKSELNEETVEIRGASAYAGEYVCNVMLYSKRDDEPVKTSVTLYKIAAGDYLKVHDEVVYLKDKGEERTAFRFTLLKDGSVVDINHMQKRFLGQGMGM